MKPYAKILLILIAGLITSVTAQAKSVECKNPTWKYTPVVQDSLFKGSLLMDCKLKGIKKPALNKIKNYFAIELKAPKLEITKLNKKLDVPVQFNSQIIRETENGPLIMDVQNRIVHFSSNFLRTVFETSKIKAKGRAKFTKKIKRTITVTKINKKGEYLLRLVEEAHVKKPWYAPKGIFTSKVKEGIIDSLNKRFRIKAQTILDKI